MNLTAVTSRAAAALVAAVAGFSSYQHIVKVATTAGEHPSVAHALPLAIDGLIVVGTAALLEDKRADREPRTSARLAVGFGIVATIAANVASAQPTWTARAVAAIPALSFLIAVEVLAHVGRPRTAERTEHATTPTPVAAAGPATGTPPADSLTAVADAIVDAIPPATSTPPLPAKRTPAKTAKGRQSNAERIAKTVAKQPAMTQAEVAKILGLGERTVQRHWPKPAATVNGHSHGEEVTA